MKRLITILFTLLTLHLDAQEAEPPPSEPKKIDTTAFPLATRLGFYPFNKAAQIMLVAFDRQEIKRDSNDWRNRPTAREIYKDYKEYRNSIPKENDTISLSMFQQKKTINTAQIEKLTDILYNTCYRWTTYQWSRAMCYQPHHAILFLDKHGKVFEYIEVCFGCSHFRFSNEKIERFEICDGSFNNLKKFFNKMGLKTGSKDFK